MDCSNYTWISGAPLTWNNWDLGHNQPRWCDRKLCVMMLEGVFRTSECSQKRLGLCEFINASSDIHTTTGSITSELTATLIPVTSSVRQISTPVPTSAWAADAVSVTMTTTQLTTNVSPQGSVRNTTDLPCTGRKANETRLSPEELMNVIKALKAELSVMKNSTSTFRRRRISVYESRPSSVVMGGVACGFMAVVIGWIVVPDVIIMCAFLCKCLKTHRITP
ncbi:uncharacterized protein [Argopecten irradians]|uniref:uncharacterized protein n=1 Tax=Argopecten irradians TaxID=31199 RepID=UPI00371C2F78